jgi:anti-sigma factor RsiW
MNEEQQLKLQALLDGELPEDEARATAAWVARDADATALLNELRNTRKALADFEPAVKLPETREFYWSKIQREIQRLEPAPRPARTVSLASLLARLIVPAGAIAALAVAALIAIHPSGANGANASTDASLTDAGAFTYRDQAAGMTVVWLSYPAEK